MRVRESIKGKYIGYMLVFVAMCLFSACDRTPSVVLYVSPEGNDSNPGTEDQPMATLAAAREAVRLHLGQKQVADITIYLNDGVYPVTGAVTFNGEDSGQDSLMVIYKAMPGTKPVISGGLEITGWEMKDNGLWAAKIPGELPEFRELFVEGKRAVRARHPNTGFLQVAMAGEDKRTNFFYSAGDFPKPSRVEEVELTLFHDWSVTRINLKEVDTVNLNISAIDTIGSKTLPFFRLDHWEPNPRYFLENAMEFLDAPFEWYADREKGLVYLKLPEGESPESMTIFVPGARQLLKLEGEKGAPVRNIRFEGITFRYCAWIPPGGRYAGVQACHHDPSESGNPWAVVPSAVEVAWAENVSFVRCTFSHLGGSGVLLGSGSSNCTVEECDFFDISGNGIMIGEGSERQAEGQVWWRSRPDEVARGNRILTSSVKDCGAQFFGAVGIWCGFTAETVIRGNEIADLPYTGISIGWLWDAEPTPCRDNLIENNHIHHIMKKLSDGGGIYSLGLQPGSIIRGNHIHDVSINAGRAESNGMFLDEGTTNIIVENNLIYNIAMSPLRFHKATTNLVKDNVLACADGIPAIRYNSTREEDIEKVGNRILNDHEDREALEKLIKEWK